ncbi:MAG: T9SS type A sorting domain-containing protein [Lutibacter sp.]|nr:T9SS type A sorting domain-containing protein [Lutibacter sp.]
MIKKLTPILAFVLLCFNLYGQTIVSTSPENKKVILEEFTGIHCVYCPQGHAIAQAIQNANPGNAFLVNIHVGSYANPGSGEPDFRTPYGTAIANQSGLIGYPAGTVNRRNFPGLEQGASGTTAMSRGQWTSAANQILGQGSYVNVGVEADINVQTNELTVHMEGYYTGDSPESTNLLNIALLQNNTKGPQTGGNMGNEYNHMHRLVEMITGQWGMTIPVTTSGTFVDETFTYPIPADYNGVLVELADLEVVAFITETHQQIASGSGCYPTFSGITNANDANVRHIVDIPSSCSGIVAPQVNIQNLGQNPITSLDISYSINSGAIQNYIWTGNITSLQNETIELPATNFSTLATNTVDVSIPSDDDNSNNDSSISFDQAIDATTSVDMELHTDAYGSEVRWNVKDYEGNTLYSGGPYGNNQTINETFDLPQYCYTFNLIDTYGDGGGAVTLTDSNATQIYYTNGTYGSGESKNFSTDGFIVILDITSNELEGVSIYPNPTSSFLNIKNAESASIEVFNMLGQVLYTKANISIDEQIVVSQFNTGTYFVKITSGNAVKTSKFIKL